MEVDQIKTGGDMKVECKFRSGGDMPMFEFSRQKWQQNVNHLQDYTMFEHFK